MWSSAVSAYQRAVEGGGRAAELFNNLGVACLELGRLDEAESALRRATEAPDAGGGPFFNLGVLLAAQRRRGLACDAYQEAVRRQPDHYEAWVNLGNQRLYRREYPQAEAAFAQAHDLRPGASAPAYLLAALRGDVPARAPSDYVRALFDQYAPTFDDHLVGDLHYGVPARLRSLVAAVRVDDAPIAAAVDLGCGSGLSGVAFADGCRRLVGVDLSPKMIERARARQIYAGLEVADIVDYLGASAARFDLFIAADVLIYQGDLAPVFAGMARCATPGALVALSVESSATEPIRLGRQGRFAHSDSHVTAAAEETGWAVRRREAGVVRLDRGREVVGRLYILGRPAAAASV